MRFFIFNFINKKTTVRNCFLSKEHKDTNNYIDRGHILFDFLLQISPSQKQTQIFDFNILTLLMSLAWSGQNIIL